MVRRHALRNSLIVVVTIVGLQLGGLISGAVVTEQIFGLPGFGKLTVDAVFQRDYPVIQGVVLITATAYIVINFAGRPALLGDRPADPRREGRQHDRRPALPPAPPPPRPRRRGAGGSPASIRRACAATRWRSSASRSWPSRSLVAVLAPWLAPYAPEQTDFANTLAPPGTPGHLLGTDDLGRDVLSRIILGLRASLRGRRCWPWPRRCSIGVPLGLAAGYFRAADAVISRFTDLLLAFPFLILAVGLAAIRGASLGNAAVAIGIAQIPGVIRVVRSDTLRLKALDFVAAAVVDGAGDLWVLAPARPAQRHVGDPRAGHRGDPRRDPRRGGAVLPRARHPAARAQPRHHARHGAAVRARGRRGRRSCRDSRSCCSPWRSTCSATACATPSTRRRADDDHGDHGTAAGPRPPRVGRCSTSAA